MCNCIKEIEKKIIENLKETNPTKTYNEELNRFEGTGFQNIALGMGANGGYKLYHEFKIESSFTKVNGDQSNPKKEAISIYPSFCAFCGVKLD